MKVVFDTNVILAAFITHGAAAEVFEHCLAQHDIVLSSFILSEVEEKLGEKFKFPPKKVRDLLRFLRQETRILSPPPLPQAVCRDADDDKVLATAVSAQAACLVSGDRDLLDLQHYEGIAIVKPADFWKFERHYQT